jgi:hypothetical protein
LARGRRFCPEAHSDEEICRQARDKAQGRQGSEEVRVRRSTANRLLTVLKAALNHAFHEGRASADEPWRKVKPFREVDAPVVRFLKTDECARLVNACDHAFRGLVRGGLG